MLRRSTKQKKNERRDYIVIQDMLLMCWVESSLLDTFTVLLLLKGIMHNTSFVFLTDCRTYYSGFIYISYLYFHVSTVYICSIYTN